MVPILIYRFQKKDNNKLVDEIRGITREKDHLHAQLARMMKKEEKMKHEFEANSLRTREAENEAAMFRNLCERQEREIKQRDSSTKSDTVRLTRQEEQILKLKTELHKSQEANSVSNSFGKIFKKSPNLH